MADKVGRPREFDRDVALDRALIEFWRNGYDGTSISALTHAMKIKPPSLYAAFGDKRKLFSEAVARYVETYGSYGSRALAEPTARAAVAKMMELAATEYTEASHPPGCLVISGAANCAPASEDVEAELRARREAAKRAIAHKIDADVVAGELPPDTDSAGLATFYAAVIQGMNTQARDGASRDELNRIAALAMAAWPAPAG